MCTTLSLLILFVYETKNTGDVTTLYINFLKTWIQNSLPWFYITIKSQTDFINWFYFLYSYNLRSPHTLAVFSRQNSELFGEYVFRISPPEPFFFMKKLFLKFLRNFENTCTRVLFLIKLQAGKLYLY